MIKGNVSKHVIDEKKSFGVIQKYLAGFSKLPHT